MRLWTWAVPLALLAGAAGGLFLLRPGPALPAGLPGVLVYVSDRAGRDSLYVRRFPGGEERRLTHLFEPVAEPAVSPDGARVAFVMGGRIGLVTIASGDVGFPTLGIDWRDASPSWSPDGTRLVVTARRPGDSRADLHLLTIEGDGRAARRALTESRGIDESAPAFAPDGSWIAFVRTDNVFRLDLPDGRTRRLTGGLRGARAPRFLPSGRLVYSWSEAKRFGIDVMDADGRNRRTLYEGAAYYDTLAPSPDGRWLAASLAFDLGFRPLDALRLGPSGVVRILDEQGRVAGELAPPWRRYNHSPTWGPAGGSGPPAAGAATP
jgi:Tol biopolymer transport system component